MKNSPLFTVLTPVFNGADCIHRVWESLLRQTLRDFEWVIVDDGSTDHLEDVVNQYQRCSSTRVRYFRFAENRGKPSAVNWGVAAAEGKYLLIADADDAFVPQALERFAQAYEELPSDLREDVHGVTCNCINPDGDLVGDPFPESPWVTDVFDMLYRHRVRGEKWGFHRTEILRQFPFNTDADRFVSENTVWFAIGARYKTLFINDALRIYYHEKTDTGSLSRTSKLRYPRGWRYSELEMINKYRSRMNLSPADKLRLFRNYVLYSIRGSVGIAATVGDVIGLRGKLLVLLAYPVALLTLVRDWGRRIWKDKSCT